MFFGLNTAVSGLLASQRGLYTVNHNLTNSRTPGYSRQQVDQRATKAHRLQGIGFQGTGTEITGINRIRDSFVDFKYWNETSKTGEWQVKRESLLEIEKIFNEPSNSSFRKYIDDFYESLDNMKTNPSDLSYREPVLKNAEALTKHINETSKRFINLREDTEENVSIKVDHINGLANQIQGLNKQIHVQEVGGVAANDLRDRRELLIDELSKIVNISVKESDDGKMDISIGGASLVNHIYVTEINFNKDAKTKDDLITWSYGGKIDLQSGELKGLTDLLKGDGKDNSYRGIPFFEDQLNHFAKTFADKFNEVHREGKGLDGSTGLDFFTYDPNEPAGTMAISKEIYGDIRKFAAGSTENPEDSENLQKLIRLREDQNFFDGTAGYAKGTPDDFIKSIMSSMAVDSMQAKRFHDTQVLLQKNLASKRMSISGVSLNEEMADMVQFQHIYRASAKMISTMDMLLDITVNRLGQVGR